MTGPHPALDREWLKALPKAEVHVHLEGCIPWSLLATTAARAGVSPPADPGGVRDLSGLLDLLDRACPLLTEASDLEDLAYAAATGAAAAGTRWTDFIINPTHWPVWRHRLPELIAALDAGFARAEDAGMAFGLCVSLKRDQSREAAMAVVELLGDLGHPRVVALSIDGNEAASGRTGKRFVPAFARAAELGLHRCAHAGESSGPEGVRDAIDLLGAERIDHGVRAVEDERLVEELARRGIPLDVCPTSNVTLGIAGSIAVHPLERLRRAGVLVSVNTDDPVLFATDLLTEYERCVSAFGWTRADVIDIARTSIAACFAPDPRRREIDRELDRFVAAGA